jgi:hypothetical protein
MHEPYDSRIWAEHGHEVAATIDEIVRKAGDAFRKLADIEFDAPWLKRPSRGF